MSEPMEQPVDTEEMAEDKYDVGEPPLPTEDEEPKFGENGEEWDEDVPKRAEDLDDGAGDYPRE